ncbi:hypothetical protein Bca52824_056167 [Brassica carinata]|uniref:Uncharacterized protein n=1 Tax=Brassica carinata TaxID=52824 RepID=A0A8X7QPZ9_BRACI|nr:hypothetical protein Bca52824_056167 [Brassica carinata]
MADSTTTAADAVTLKRDIKKILTEILSYGGGSKDLGETGILMKAIYEANRIINSLREVEPETDILSPSLEKRISSPSSVADQAQAAEELRRQTKRFANVRTFFVSELPGSSTRLLSPLSAVDLNLELQENLITTPL